MKNKKIIVCFMLILAIALLSSCNSVSGKTKMVIEMELSNNQNSTEPFISEKLIYVSDNIDTLNLDVSFQMKGESGTLEISDNETQQVFWSDAWNGDIEKTTFIVSLDKLDKEKEYVIRFNGTKISYAKIVITSENSLIKEREKPIKPNRD